MALYRLSVAHRPFVGLGLTTFFTLRGLGFLYPFSLGIYYSPLWSLISPLEES